MKDADGLKREPTYIVDAPGGAVFSHCYHNMEKHMSSAAAAIREARPLVDDRHRLAFDAEANLVLWLYHTAHTHANFYDSCEFRDSLLLLLQKPELTDDEIASAKAKLVRWREVLMDEKKNTETALSLVANDMRLDPYYGGDHMFSHGADMIRAKLELLDREISEFLPSLEAGLGK
jgi:hypothetical protein